jgi:hypothetical protein
MVMNTGASLHWPGGTMTVIISDFTANYLTIARAIAGEAWDGQSWLRKRFNASRGCHDLNPAGAARRPPNAISISEYALDAHGPALTPATIMPRRPSSPKAAKLYSHQPATRPDASRRSRESRQVPICVLKRFALPPTVTRFRFP